MILVIGYMGSVAKFVEARYSIVFCSPDLRRLLLGDGVLMREWFG